MRLVACGDRARFVTGRPTNVHAVLQKTALSWYSPGELDLEKVLEPVLHSLGDLVYSGRIEISLRAWSTARHDKAIGAV